METYVLLARILAILFLATGLAAIFNKNLYRKIVEDTFKNSAITFFLGLATLIISFLIITYHNVWEGWPVLITIVGWIGLIKGVLIMVHPKLIENFSKPIFKGKLSKIIPHTTIVIGLIFGYFGFLA